MIISH